MLPKTMKAAVIDKFGGPQVLHVSSIPVPEPGENEILLRIHAAGIGTWDPWLREGGASAGRFPQVLGSDGAGTVVARGSKARRFKVGDRVYAYAYDNQKGGFYAEYAAVSEDDAARIPANLGTLEAGALPASGVTALLGLEKLKIGKAEALMILGASGGVGHVALQLANRMGARTLAVSSRTDGVDMTRRLGADLSVDGRSAKILGSVKGFAENLDAALVFANSKRLAEALGYVKKGGRIAFPRGVEPEPAAFAGVKVLPYDGISSPEVFERLNGLIARGLFHVAIHRTYRLEEAAQAHRDVSKHHLGKLIFKIHG
ncbi:MAG: quinone oxidoreductase family protein [Candidatus Aminicenantales bacterium]